MKQALRTLAMASGIALAGVGAVGVASAATPGIDAPELSFLQDADLQTEDQAEGERSGCNKLQAAADAIGIDVDTLRTELDADQTIAEVATANGVDPDLVVDAMLDASEERLAEKVAEGRLTQDEADTKLAEKTDRIEDKVFGADDDVDAPTGS